MLFTLKLLNLQLIIMTEKARISLKINGRVQGVFFRVEIKKQAERLGLFGWVRNNNDGSVECLIEGDKEKLEKLINWCKIGSDSAKVDEVKIKWLPWKGEYKSIEIIF